MNDHITEDVLKLLGFENIDDKQRLWRHKATGISAKWERQNLLYGVPFDVWQFACDGEPMSSGSYLDSPTEIMGYAMKVGCRNGRNALRGEFKELLRKE
jgi:hypothetical protein